VSEDRSAKKGAHPPEPSAEGGQEEERPTIAPPFDVEAFARAATAGGARPEQAPGATGTPREPRDKQVTLTNELELERARAQSAVSEVPARPHHTPSVLSMANARIPSTPAIPAPRTPTPTSIEAAVLGAIAAAPGPEISERTIDDPVAEMAERFKLGDYTGALEMSELILAEDPGNLEAAECGESCRTVLVGMYAAKLAPLNRSPVVVVPRSQMRWLSIDHRAGFVLSLIDGSVSVETVLDLSGMPRLDALRILHELVQQRIVALK
jgi:hypothetical protein